ncbi:unnamed protein product [Sphagnum balticum]
MDKMIKDGRGETLITNDGATILQKLDVVHPTAKMVALDIIKNQLSIPVEISNRDTLIECVTTSLSSKVVSSNSDILSPMAVDAVLRIIDPKTAVNVDLKDIRIVKKLGGTI